MAKKTLLVNIDAIAPEITKQIKLNGQIHPYKPASIKTYMSEMKRARELEKSAEKGDISEEDMFEAAVDFVLAVFPTVKREELMDLSFMQLNAIRDVATIDAEPTEEVKDDAGKE